MSELKIPKALAGYSGGKMFGRKARPKGEKKRRMKKGTRDMWLRMRYMQYWKFILLILQTSGYKLGR